MGDWSAKIWFEELKSPIIRTRYHGAYLTDGCFSPTRPGVFFLTRKVFILNFRMVGWMFGIYIIDKMNLLIVIKFQIVH